MEKEETRLRDAQRQGHRYGRKKRLRKIALSLLCAAVVLGILTGAYLYFSAAKVQGDFAELASQARQSREQYSDEIRTEPAAEKIAEQALPAAEEIEQPQMLPAYASIYARNPDLFGWIRIEDTVIDYPVMYTPEEPEKYLHANFEGEYSYEGVPFVDANCTADSDNIIIYAHNMLNGTMFRELMKYDSKTYWEKHPQIIFDTLYEEQTYEVLAAFYDRVYYKSETCFKFYQFINAADEADFENAMANYREKALYDTGVEAEYGDQLITLVTCAYHVENGRFVVVARKK